MLSHFCDYVSYSFNWPFKYRNLQEHSGAVVPGLSTGKCGEGKLNEVDDIWKVGLSKLISWIRPCVCTMLSANPFVRAFTIDFSKALIASGTISFLQINQ